MPLSGTGGFFGTGTMPTPAVSLIVDPRCIYDPWESRFIVVGIERDPPFGAPFVPPLAGAWILIAISATSDPTGLWYKYRISAMRSVLGYPRWADFPGVGVDLDALYICANLYAPTPAGLPTGAFYSTTGAVLYWVLPKAANYFGPAAPVVREIQHINYSGMEIVRFVQPAHSAVFGSGPPMMYFVSCRNGPSTTGNFFRIQRIRNPLAVPPTLETLPLVTVPIYTTPSFSGPGAGAPQPPAPGGGTYTLSTLLGEPLNAVWYSGGVATAHAISVGGKTTVRWYWFDCSSCMVSPPNQAPYATLSEYDTIDTGPGIHTYFPAIMPADSGIALAMTRSSTTEHAGIWFTGRLWTHPPSTTLVPMTPIRTGSVTYTAGTAPGTTFVPWADYFGLSPDPADPWVHWAVGCYALSATTWGTRIASFRLDCPGGYTSAAFANYGAGYPGTLGVPSLTLSAPPVPGFLFEVLLDNSAGVPTTAFLAVGPAPAATPIAPGATILVDLSTAILLPVTLGPGVNSLFGPIVIVNGCALSGLTLFGQAAETDSGSPLGVSLTPGLTVTFGY
jgi:hypothetical protein